MNATLLESFDRTVRPYRREVELSALVEKLPGEVPRLRGEVAELRQQVGYWKGMFMPAKRKNVKLKQEIDSLRTGRCSSMIQEFGWTTTPRSEWCAARPWAERTITARARSGVSA